MLRQFNFVHKKSLLVSSQATRYHVFFLSVETLTRAFIKNKYTKLNCRNTKLSKH